MEDHRRGRGDKRRGRKQRQNNNNVKTKIPCIDLLDSDDDDDVASCYMSRKKSCNKRKRKSRDEVVLHSASSNFYAGMDPASYALIQRMEQQDMMHQTDKLIAGDDDFALARRLQAAERAKSRNCKHEEPSSMEDVLPSLDKCQRDALCAIESEARKRHETALPKVRQRITSLGYKTEDLDNCLKYIRNEAPIIIHMNENCLRNLAKPEETHYRNLFEVNTSGGSSSTGQRKQWERNMFGHFYDNATPFQRVKYGCINLTGDIEGVAPARSYGNLFMTLKSSVRHRCTFFNMDTSSFGSGHGLSSYGAMGLGGGFGSRGTTAYADTLATARNYCHILVKYSDQELHSILALNKIGGGKSKCAFYKEVQIHGPVRLATDIEKLSLPGREADATKDMKDLVEKFRIKTDCAILWQGDLLGYDSSTHSGPGMMPPGMMGMPPMSTAWSTLAAVAAGYSAPAAADPFSGYGHVLGGGTGYGGGSGHYTGTGSTSGYGGGGSYGYGGGYRGGY